MIAVFAILGIYPFGPETVMTGDTTYQLVDYLSYYKTILFGNNDFTYSLSKNMGGEMSGFAAYYLFSPLNLLTLPFSKEDLFIGIGLIIILVPGLSALSMCYVLRNLKEENENALVFSLCYGLSAYVIIYNELLYYYTNIILLPLIFLLLRKSMKGIRYLNIKYILLLAVAIMNNYYTGYMICIFLLIYTIYYLAGVYDGKDRIYLFCRFAVNSILAVLLSCITLIPAVMSLSGEKDNFSIAFYFCFPPLYYFSKLYTGSFAGDFGAGMPNIYCGLIVTLMLALILINKNIRCKNRVWIGLMLMFFWFDFFINTLNVIWHGLNQPIGFPYRQAFVVVFFCIITAFEYADITLKINNRYFIVLLSIFIIYSLYALIEKIDSLNILSVIVTAIIIISVLAAFFMPVKYRTYIITIITVMDLFFNTWQSLSHLYPTSIDEYQEPLNIVTEAIDDVKALGDTDIFRTEKMFRRTNNDAMMLDYAGLTHFSSSEKKETIKFMGKLGFRDNGNWAMYTGINTALADSILGVRYLLSQFDTTGKPYDQILSEDGYHIYKNTHAIPIMSAVSNDVYNVILTDNPFENQNMIADAMTGTRNEILYMQNAELNHNPDGSISYDVKIKNDGTLYCFISAPFLQNAKLYLDGDEWTDYFTTYNWATVDLQERKKGDIVHVDIKPTGEEPITVDEGFFAVINNDNLIKWSDEIKKEEAILYKKTSSCFEGEYVTNRGNILFSLPMDKGWHLFIDNEEYEIKEACDHMMAAEVPNGRHLVKLVFVTPGKKIGYIISIAVLLFLTTYCAFFKKAILYLEQKEQNQESLKKF